MQREHSYKIDIKWTGNTGDGTRDVRSYERDHLIQAPGKPDIVCSSDPSFPKGDGTKWNPEELLIASLASCHMLWYLHLCADRKIIVMDYQDRPSGQLVIEAGEGRFKEIVLNPLVTITDATRIHDAEKLHEQAHHKCFIARSINFPVKLNPRIRK